VKGRAIQHTIANVAANLNAPFLIPQNFLPSKIFRFVAGPQKMLACGKVKGVFAPKSLIWTVFSARW
jgi:hypothetical protein